MNPMRSFQVLKTTQSGLAVLEAGDGDKEPAAKELPLYAGRNKVATVVETIASVDRPLYLAKPLAGLKKGMILVSKGKR